jgi:hypothetical protein
MDDLEVSANSAEANSQREPLRRKISSSAPSRKTTSIVWLKSFKIDLAILVAPQVTMISADGVMECLPKPLSTVRNCVAEADEL